MHAKNKVLWGMITLSLGVHALLFLWFTVQKHVPVSSKRGVVSVSFVESVVHQPPPPSSRPKMRPDTVNTKPQNTPTAQTSAPPEPPPPQGDPKVIANESNLFIGSVTKLLEKNKIYPQEAIDREEQGKVIVGLTLDREGILTASNIEEPSPFQLLNDAALKTVRAVPHFPRVPDMVPAPIHLHVPLVYRIERN